MMQETTEPRVDVIICCYNKGPYLAEAVDSALGQTYRNIGVLVVDDGSTDNSPAVADSYGSRIRYLRKANGGVSAARNTGILEARAEFVLFLDADDYCERDMIEKLMGAARDNPAASVFHGSYQRVDINGGPLPRIEKEPLDEDAFHDLLEGNHFACHAAVTRRAAFANAGIFDTSLASSEDWDMWIRLAAAGCRFVAVPDAVAYYRCCPGSLSSSFDRMWQTGLAVLEKNRSYHHACPLCRRAIARSRARLREYCFEMLVADLYARKARAGLGASLSKAVGEIRRDPGLARLLLREIGPYLRGEHAVARRRSVEGGSQVEIAR